MSRILLVDDEPDIVNILSKALLIHGLAVDYYTDSTKALEEFLPGRYDLLILDFKMPRMNGFQLYEKILKIDSRAKACFLSGDAVHYKEYQDIMPELNPNRFMHKPISLKKFVDDIKTILEQ